MIKIKHKGNFNNLESFINRVIRKDYLNVLAEYGKIGVHLLSDATPKDSGETANSWNYVITSDDKTTSLTFTNSSMNKGVSIVMLLRYGHATKNGYWVEGKNFIDPAIGPLLDSLAEETWKEVTAK